MKYQLLTTTLFVSLALSAPFAYETNIAQRANKQSCSDKPHPTLEDFYKAAKTWCNEHIRADAPMPPLLPKPITDPKNPPIMPPLRAQYTFNVPNPDKKKPAISVPATFEIRGFGPIQREYCLLGFGLPNDWKDDKDKTAAAQIEKHNICAGKGGESMVQGWNESVWWNDYGVVFG
jgi:hypothetical protein